jgi:putative ABC transport system permease protein
MKFLVLMMMGMVLVGCDGKKQKADSELLKLRSDIQKLREENNKLADEPTTIEAVETNIAGENLGYDAILGPRGSELQLVFNSLFHIGPSTGLVKSEDYLIFRERYNRFYRRAVPIAVGDNYKGHRIVGTTLHFFDVEFAIGRKYDLSEGEFFIQNEKQWNKEAVIGDTVARKMRLQINSKFQPDHGLNFNPNQKPHKDQYTVTGILKPTGTPADRVIWIPIEGLQQMDGHDSRFAGDVSAVLIQMSDDTSARGFGMNSLDMIYNRGTDHLTFVRSINDTLVSLDSQIDTIKEAHEIIKRWPRE